MVNKKSTNNKFNSRKKIKNKKGVVTRSDFLNTIASIGIVTILLLSLLNLLNSSTSIPKEVLGATDTYAEEVVFWQSLLDKNPTYLDGWIELSKIELDKENIGTAKMYYEKSKVINPNSNKLTELEKLIYNKEAAINQTYP